MYTNKGNPVCIPLFKVGNGNTKAQNKDYTLASHFVFFVPVLSSEPI